MNMEEKTWQLAGDEGKIERIRAALLAQSPASLWEKFITEVSMESIAPDTQETDPPPAMYFDIVT